MPVIHLPLGDPMPAVPMGLNERRVYPTQWSDPRHTPPTRPYGDEFQYGSFNEMRRKWTMRNTVAGDFDFMGSYGIGWKQSSSHSGFYLPAPSGNMEVVLEYSPGSGLGSGSAGLQMGIIDAVGTGGLGSTNGSTDQTWTAVTWALTGNVTASSSALDFKGGHKWMSIKRSGTTLTFRNSNNGSTWNAFGGGVTVPAAGYLVIGSLHNSDVPGYAVLHRLTVYGPGFFPG